MLTVATFLWSPPRGYRSQFTPEHVNILARMVKRRYAWPHRFVCITDLKEGYDPDLVEVTPLWDDYAKIPSPWGAGGPSCYRRLKVFSPEIEAILGKRFVVMDIDTVIVDDLLPLWGGDEPFRIYGQTTQGNYYNGSMLMMNAGARPQVWTDFDPNHSPLIVKRGGFKGSDQGWISYKLGKGEMTWRREDGVYSYRLHIRPQRGVLPPNARMVFFHGRIDPWHHEAQRLSWVRDNWK